MGIGFITTTLPLRRPTNGAGLVQREQSARSARRRYRAASLCANGATDSAPEGAEPSSLNARDWREVRAVLHAGSESAFQEQLARCHRPGHWAHPLSL
eukprot:IDg11008t1